MLRIMSRRNRSVPSLSRRQWLSGAASTLAMVSLLPPSSLAQSDGPDQVILRAAPAKLPLRAGGGLSDVPAFSGLTPGPTVKMRQGESINISIINDLSETLTPYWHGVRTARPAWADAEIRPTRRGEFPIRPPDAGTFWYRTLPRTGGLYGLLIVEEKTPPDIDRDAVLVLDDWGLGDGRTVTANGRPSADIPIRAGERIRLRLLNAAPDRMMQLCLDTHPVWVMAIDGQPAAPFVARDGRLTLAPGNRIDVFLDATSEPGATAPILLDQDGSALVVARLVYESGRRDGSLRGAPPPLPGNPLPERIDMRAASRPTIELSEPPSDLAFKVARGRPVVLTLTNRGAVPTAVHMQGHHVRLLDKLDDGWKPFWLDTLVVTAGQTERVAFLPDRPGRWAIETTPLLPGATATMRRFEVT
ncbi:MAG: multicopper oxidase domain-containing protein [Pseudorhodoplanes sp.]|nr:multicopper oxidase domain-containing protein [Pseudorhodoplanes sp.]